jgi:hypothetical protein
MPDDVGGQVAAKAGDGSSKDAAAPIITSDQDFYADKRFRDAQGGFNRQIDEKKNEVTTHRNRVEELEDELHALKESADPNDAQAQATAQARVDAAKKLRENERGMQRRIDALDARDKALTESQRKNDIDAVVREYGVSAEAIVDLQTKAEMEVWALKNKPADQPNPSTPATPQNTGDNKPQPDRGGAGNSGGGPAPKGSAADTIAAALEARGDYAPGAAGLPAGT